METITESTSSADKFLYFNINYNKIGKTRSNRTNLDLPERGIDLPDVTEVGATVAPSNYNSDYNTEDITDDDTFTDSAKSRNAATAPPSSREGTFDINNFCSIKNPILSKATTNIFLLRKLLLKGKP